ncbi:unnamed protein product [Timema podura]|uniref:Secreted protein n=1 Tax=Timema podura TaxID=61482 RepID=A0ABN7PN84_TIMPD|nr:unnamed protein product [Timema podura]
MDLHLNGVRTELLLAVRVALHSLLYITRLTGPAGTLSSLTLTCGVTQIVVTAAREIRTCTHQQWMLRIWHQGKAVLQPIHLRVTPYTVDRPQGQREGLTPNRDSNLDLPVIGSLVSCESEDLYHAANGVG